MLFYKYFSLCFYFSTKSRLIQDKNAVMSESNFIMTNKDFTSSANYNDKFPIDILCI